ncbi:MAG TPA: M20 family metallopeptidase [Acidimicrobiia bacterium]
MTAVDAPDLLTAAGAVLDDAVALRREIHRHPEQGLLLPRTQQVVVDALAPLDLVVTTGTNVTSVVADIVGAQPGPTVLLRADMDALPMPEDTGLDFASEVDGAMHACGHDAHTAMLCGAARVLAERRDTLAGRVRLMFQPGEEGYHGARWMIEEGVLEGPRVDAAFALHVTPNAPTGSIATRGGPIMAAADVLHITVTGKGGHASSPYLANDPMPVAAEIVTALQVFATRRINQFDPVVITITKIRGGTTNNVIPESVVMEGTLRSVSEGSRGAARAGIARIVEHVAAAHEMTADLEVIEGYPVVVNDFDHAAFTRRVAAGLLGAESANEMPAPVMGAEDFSYVLNERPGAFAYLGVCPPGERPAHAHGCHSNRMTIDEPAMRNGIAIYAALAIEYLAAGGDVRHALTTS